MARMPRPTSALIVDDETHVRVYMKILLKQLGVTTIWEAAEGYAAIEQASEHKPDVVLLDINLPQLNGLEVLARMKAANPNVHVIVVSVESKPETLVQARELGADAYVLKHLPRAKVLSMLSDVFDEIAAGPKDKGPADAGGTGAPA
jgi:DNA-binding NarL/FixJ family response regulator